MCTNEEKSVVPAFESVNHKSTCTITKLLYIHNNKLSREREREKRRDTRTKQSERERERERARGETTDRETAIQIETVRV